jgi:stearoyl-CoA desaturase (delta-9 desaturase)
MHIPFKGSFTQESGKSQSGLLQILVLISIPFSFYFLSTEQIFLSFAIGYLIAVFGLLVGLHRYFSHQSYKVNSFNHYVLVFVSTIITNSSILKWSNIHDIHHEYSDSKVDPHSPKHLGKIRAYFRSWFDWDWKLVPTERYEKLKEQKGLVFSDTYYVHIIVSWICLILIVEPMLIWALYSFPVFISLNISSSVNTFTHNEKGDTINSPILSWILCGDGGYHKEHHEKPWTVCHGFPDLTGYMIKLIRK